MTDAVHCKSDVKAEALKPEGGCFYSVFGRQPDHTMAEKAEAVRLSQHACGARSSNINNKCLGFVKRPQIVNKGTMVQNPSSHNVFFSLCSQVLLSPSS